jgi:hypothetical protein
MLMAFGEASSDGNKAMKMAAVATRHNGISSCYTKLKPNESQIRIERLQCSLNRELFDLPCSTFFC